MTGNCDNNGAQGPHASAPCGPAVSLDELTAFLADFARTFICAGGHTGRVDRSMQRIGLAFGVSVETLLLSRHAVLTVTCLRNKAEYRTVVAPFAHIIPNFSVTFALNSLSWEFFDSWLENIGGCSPARKQAEPGMTVCMGYLVPEDALRTSSARDDRSAFEHLQRRFHDSIQHPRPKVWLLCLMTGLACASFCRLLGGDWLAMAVVLFVTQGAFLLRRFLVVRHGVDIRLTYLAVSFIATFASAIILRWVPSGTPEIAVASGILFLVPGIPLLTAVNDILQGHTLMGISRGANAAMLTLCMAFGLAATLMVTGFNVL
ncbi:threonine/serine exporter family protein [Desulfovibrio sp. OttesenSCG-928-M14]|nr:threonine/serine exporter family protein [Desulfovibrio sp. OttesenSCG-928-M14]